MSTFPSNSSIRNIYVPIEEEPEVTEEVCIEFLKLVTPIFNRNFSGFRHWYVLSSFWEKNA